MKPKNPLIISTLENNDLRISKRIFVFIFFALILGSFNFVYAQDKIEVNFFFSETCLVCKGTNDFLDGLADKYFEIKLNKYSLSNQENINLLTNLYIKHQTPRENYGLVPAVFIENKSFIGMDNNVAVGIEDYILALIASQPVTTTTEEKLINLPFIGEIDPVKYSLPVLSVMLGFFDGFNVCSLGALVLILGLVLVLRSRKKILIFGSIFIGTTAIIYGLLIVLWYKVFSFFASYLRLMEITVGLLGVAGGLYFLKEFIRFKKSDPTCEIKTGQGIITKFSEKIQKGLQEKKNILIIMFSVLLFAGIIAVVEFPCSAAVPLFFASILAKAELSTFQYLSYIALFILFYMFDEIIIFLIAFFTMTVKLTSAKFVTWITLIESIVLFLLGFYYLFGFLLF